MLFWLGLLVVAGAVWIAVTALIARNQAGQLRADLQQIRALVSRGDLNGARAAAARLPAAADRLHRLTTGPAWWAAAHVPYLGDPLAELRGVTAALASVGDRAVPPLVEIAADLDPQRLRVSGDAVNLQPLIAARPQLAKAARVLDDAVARIDALPAHTWISQVDVRVADLGAQLRGVSGYVDAASRAADILPGMLGDRTPQRYFVGLQNEAEIRGTGGLPGAFAIAVADHGRVRFVQFASDQAILRAPRGGTHVATGLQFGAGYDHAYGSSEPTTSFLNSNVSPNFPYTGQIWARMWERVSGQHVDGAIALDPTVLSYLLQATGPVQVPQRMTVSAANVVSLTQRDEYTLFSDNNARKAFLVSVLKATGQRVTAGAGAATALARAIVRSTAQQRFQVWAADPHDEQVLEQTTYAAAIPVGDRPLSAAVLNNAAAGKLDYYLQRTLDYHRSGCGSRRDVRVTITLTNTAPAAGLPPYVTGRADRHPGITVHPGDNRTLLDYYATTGAELQSVTVNDEPATAGVEQDLGHPIFRLDLELPRGSTTTVVLHLTEPAGSGDPLIWRQPGVTPLAVSAYSQKCG